MRAELYFLRSSEQKIVTDMLKHAHPQDTQNIDIYDNFYGLTPKDLGLYALVDNKIAGAIWSRRLNKEHNSTGYVDENTPVLSMGVLPEFRNSGIGSQMLEQFLLEAGELYEQISINTYNPHAMNFYKKFGFVECQPFANYTQDPHSLCMTLLIK